MKRKIKITNQLFMVKIIFYLLVIVAACIVTWTKHYAEAASLAILSFLFLLFLYKCPHCGYSLDFRLRIKEDTPCPLCGKVISNYEKNE